MRLVRVSCLFIVPLLLYNCARFGATPLHRAAADGDARDVERLLLDGANANTRDQRGNTPLHSAVARYVENRPQVKMTGEAGFERTTQPLPIAGLNDTAIVQMLLSNGANPNARNQDGRTPLHLAVINDKADLAGLLLAAGADPGIRDDNGKSALDLALTHGLGRIISLLQTNKALGPLMGK